MNSHQLEISGFIVIGQELNGGPVERNLCRPTDRYFR
jgi:hypothetical protein